MVLTSLIVLSLAASSAKCKIYKVTFQLLDITYKYTNQMDIADVIKHRQKIFMLKFAVLS